jgi:hypothetical protein
MKILKCQDRGLILFWLLFEGCAIRITPPLTISEEEIKEGCAIIIEVMNEVPMTIKISTLRDRLTLDVLLIKLFTTIQIFLHKNSKDTYL